MLIDTHCHLDFPQFIADRDEVIARAKAVGVEAIINIGSTLRRSRDVVELALRYPHFYASVGIHPHDAKSFNQEALKELDALAREDKVVAIGEVGLDYFRNLSPKDDQVKVFEKFIGLADSRKLPLVVHCRQAQDDVLSILCSHQDLLKNGVVIHCFSGDLDFLRSCLDLGFFVSFTANITYEKADISREVVAYVPLERMFLETDAPFLSPLNKRGKRNEPGYLPELAHEVARIKKIDFEKVCCETTNNAKKFFNLKI
ncbi:MAG: TatD family hydrolase [Candidatus Omnitrophota bacterium]